VLWIMEDAMHSLTALTHLEASRVPVLKDIWVTDSIAQVRMLLEIFDYNLLRSTL